LIEYKCKVKGWCIAVVSASDLSTDACQTGVPTQSKSLVILLSKNMLFSLLSTVCLQERFRA